MAKLHRLDWDSAFFGFPIGEVRLGGASVDDLECIDHAARAAGIDCVYGYLDPSDPSLILTAQRHGWRLVEVMLMFDLRRSEPPVPRPEGIEFRMGVPEDLDAILPVAEEMAPWSRFAVDERFGLEASRRMQQAWAARCLSPEDETHRMLVSVEDGELTAFLGLVFDPVARVDAVGTIRRGSGAARYMMEMARDLAQPHDLRSGRAAARNIAVQRYVAHCGFRTCDVEYVFHRWLDEPIAI